jgi:hypothetical protein
MHGVGEEPRAPSTHIAWLSRPAGSRTADLMDTEVAALELGGSVGQRSWINHNTRRPYYGLQPNQ